VQQGNSSDTPSIEAPTKELGPKEPTTGFGGFAGFGSGGLGGGAGGGLGGGLGGTFGGGAGEPLGTDVIGIILILLSLCTWIKANY
jgi:hypothetical protein